MSRSTPPRLGPSSSASPCVDVCTVHPDGSHCMGCFRTLDEIAGWSHFDEDQRRKVLALTEERRAVRREERRAQRRARTQSTQPGS